LRDWLVSSWTLLLVGSIVWFFWRTTRTLSELWQQRKETRARRFAAIVIVAALVIELALLGLSSLLAVLGILTLALASFAPTTRPTIGRYDP
jgi:hypothetical protein